MFGFEGTHRQLDLNLELGLKLSKISMVGCCGCHNGAERKVLVGTAKDGGWTEIVVIMRSPARLRLGGDGG